MVWYIYWYKWLHEARCLSLCLSPWSQDSKKQGNDELSSLDRHTIIIIITLIHHSAEGHEHGCGRDGENRDSRVTFLRFIVYLSSPHVIFSLALSLFCSERCGRYFFSISHFLLRGIGRMVLCCVCVCVCHSIWNPKSSEWIFSFSSFFYHLQTAWPYQSIAEKKWNCGRDYNGYIRCYRWSLVRPSESREKRKMAATTIDRRDFNIYDIDDANRRACTLLLILDDQRQRRTDSTTQVYIYIYHITVWMTG